MDFVVGLPASDGFDAFRVVVDHLTKQRNFVPCRSDVDAEALADLFLAHVFRLHGLPLSIISDCGPQFAAHFWTHLCNCLGIEPRLSTAFHRCPLCPLVFSLARLASPASLLVTVPVCPLLFVFVYTGSILMRGLGWISFFGGLFGG